MRKLALSLVVIVVVGLIVAFYPRYVDKPALDSHGEMAIIMDPRFPAPQYHSPIDWWQTHHMNVVNRGDIVQEDCLYCHVPSQSCNNCHNYVGVDEIVP